MAETLAEANAEIAELRARLDSHERPDDGDKITDEWLRSIGFVEMPDWCWQYKNIDLMHFSDGELDYWHDTEYDAQLDTRGHVRRLLAALGIEVAL